MPHPPVYPDAETVWTLWKTCRDLFVLPETFFTAARYRAFLVERNATHIDEGCEASLLVAAKVWESMDEAIGPVSGQIMEAEARLVAKLNWHLHPPTLFDEVNLVLKREAPPELRRLVALLAIVEGVCVPCRVLARALVNAHREPGKAVTHPLVRRVVRIVLLVGRDDVVSTQPLIVSQRFDVVHHERPLNGMRLCVDGGVCDGVEVECIADALGTELRAQEDAARMVLLHERFVVFRSAALSPA